MTARVLLCLDKLAHPRTGMGQFSLHLARALAIRSDDSPEYTLLVPRAARPLLQGLDATVETLGRLDKEKVLRWTRPIGPLTPGQRRRPAVWHALAQDAKYLPFDRETPVLLTIHDLNYLRDTEERERLRRLRVVQSRVDRSAVIVAVSRFTAGEVSRHLDVGDRPVHVVHNGLPETGSIEPTKPAAAPPPGQPVPARHR